MDSPPPSYESLIKDSNEGCQPNTIPVPEPTAPPLEAPIRLRYWDDLMRNRPQRNSMNAAYFIFTSAGVGIAYSIGFGLFRQTSTHFRMSWFIGAIIGSLIALALVKRFTKRSIYFIAIGLISINGICLLFLHFTLFYRYCDGIAFGITLPAFIMAASEQSDKRFRALTLGLEQVCITLGMLVATFVIQRKILFAYTDHINNGFFVLICAFLSLLSNLLCTIESPVYHLQNDNEAKAIKVLHYLRKRLLDSNEVPELLAEHKKLLEEDAARGLKTKIMLSLRIFPKIIVLLILTTISFSIPIDGISSAWPSIFDIRHFMISRLVGVIIGCCTLDVLGRRGLTSLSLFIGGILLYFYGVQSDVAMIFIQLFAGIVAPTSTSYLGEAFSLSVKPYYIVLSLCLGYQMQIILFFSFIDSFVYTVGAIQIAFAIFFFVTTHESKGISLRDALVELSKPSMVKMS